MPRVTSVGQLLVNSILPEDMRDYNRVLDKKTMTQLLADLAQQHPDQYREVSHKLANIGWKAAERTGGNSFGLEDILQAKTAVTARKQLRRKIYDILHTDDEPEKKNEAILRATGKLMETQQKDIFDESLAENNPLSQQVLSGSRGNKMNLASLRGSDLLYVDHRDRVIPFPVLKSYSQGLNPAEFWAGTYGGRKGLADTKFATRDAGYLAKVLNQIVHRSLVTGYDAENDTDTLRGLPVPTDDNDSEGSLLSHPAAGYTRNTVLTPKILADIRGKGVKKILVRSPAVGGPADGGVYSRDAGIREAGRLPYTGEHVALAATQALAEGLTQAQLSSKHSGGVSGVGKAISGFDYINQLVQIPKHFKGGAAHSDKDGTVQRIEKAPQGGHYVTVDGKKHYVGAGFDLKVVTGDEVEAGDVLSEGLPNPAVITKYKGIGEGRKYFIDTFVSAYRDAGLGVNRRNVELLSKGAINHVRVTDETYGGAPDDVIQYNQLEHDYKPREDSQTKRTEDSRGQYLERPYLHYSIGTKVRPSVIKQLQEFGVNNVAVHKDPPPFQPEMVRGMANLHHDPDWITRMFGSGLKSSLLKGVHRGASSDSAGTSFVPGLAQASNFGQIGKVITPKSEQFKSTQPSSSIGLN